MASVRSLVQFTQSAQTDLLEAWLFIAEDNLAAADRLLDQIERETQTLLLQPADKSGTSGTGNWRANLADLNALCAVLCGERTKHYGAACAASR